MKNWTSFGVMWFREGGISLVQGTGRGRFFWGFFLSWVGRGNYSYHKLCHSCCCCQQEKQKMSRSQTIEDLLKLAEARAHNFGIFGCWLIESNGFFGSYSCSFMRNDQWIMLKMTLSGGFIIINLVLSRAASSPIFFLTMIYLIFWLLFCNNCYSYRRNERKIQNED